MGGDLRAAALVAAVRRAVPVAGRQWYAAARTRPERRQVAVGGARVAGGRVLHVIRTVRRATW